MQIKNNDAYFLVVGFLVFLGSLFLSRIYVGGDQYGYHGAYAAIEGLGWDYGVRFYESRVSSIERVHFIFSLLGSSLGIEKNLLMSIANGFLAAYAMKLFDTWGADFRVSVVIVLTNFYVLVLYFAAERLKFGFLLLVLALLWARHVRIFFALIFLSIFSHISMLFIMVGMWLSGMSSRLKEGGWVGFALPPVMLGLGLLYESEHLLWKIKTYVELQLGHYSLAGFFPVIVLLSFSCVYARNFVRPLLLFLPVIVGVAIFGGSRINMLGYFIFLYFALKVRGGVNVGVLSTSAYLAYKSLVFVSNVVNHGHGFE